jgi:hypothetical protein
VFQVSAQQIVEDVVPGTRASFAEGGGPDKRSYQVDRSKIVRVLPEFGPRWTVRRGVEQLYEGVRSQRLDLRGVHRHSPSKRCASYRKPASSTASSAGGSRWVRGG